MTLSDAVLLALLAVATVTDVARHRIYNWTTYPGILAGLLLNSVAVSEAGGLQFDAAGLEAAALGFFACGFIMLFCFVLFNLGGGDVKLIAMLGAFLGWQRGLEAMLWTFVLGGILGTAVVIWQVGFLRLVAQGWEHLRYVWRAKSWVPLTEEEREPLRRWLFLAPMSLLAAGIVIYRG